MRLLRLCFAISVFIAGKNSWVVGSEQYGTVVGIDLGTTYSCVAVYQGGRVDIIPNEQGNRVTPSWVGFSGNERLIGDTAKQVFHTIPSQTIFDAKRLLGRRFDDVSLREDARHWPFKIIDNHGHPAFEVEFQGKTKIFTPQEISAMILSRLKETAQAYLGHPVTHAVVTVPAYFNDEQRQATKHAGQIAGLTVLRIINEPTAAAIAYGLDKSRAKASNTVVYDLGGGTFDVSLLRMDHGAFKVLATAGNTRLGGEDFDNRVMDYLIDRYKKQTTVDISENKRAISKLKREVEKAKRFLSSQLTVRLEIESFEGGNDFSSILTRAKFEELNFDLFKQTLEPVIKVLKDARLEPKDIDDIILVGGSTRIPMIRQLLKDFFGGREPRMGINPDEAVAYGAAIQASILSGNTPFSKNDVLVEDLSSFTFGIKTAGKFFEYHKSVCGVSSQLIARNTHVPVRKSEIFSTASDNQRTVLIQILQGDNHLAEDNILLGNFMLTGILPAARGVPQIEVIFEVDVDGLLTVTAHDKDGGSQESITVTADKRELAQTDIIRMAKEEETLSQNDREARARSAALNELQQTIAVKRSHLNGDELRGRHTVVHAELDEHSHWAETSGSLASLAEINRRVKQVEEMMDIREANNSTTVVTSTLVPDDVGREAEAASRERTEAPEITACANVPPNALALREDL
ncbi:ATPase with role in protein import into the ER [Ceratobasidium sp. 395]|nr:ATPase with role in protein import into the ER [Ceratobasidium sp. 395]